MSADRLNDFRLTIFRFAVALRDSFDFGFSRIRQKQFPAGTFLRHEVSRQVLEKVDVVVGDACKGSA